MHNFDADVWNANCKEIVKAGNMAKVSYCTCYNLTSARVDLKAQAHPKVPTKDRYTLIEQSNILSACPSKFGYPTVLYINVKHSCLHLINNIVHGFDFYPAI